MDESVEDAAGFIDCVTEEREEVVDREPRRRRLEAGAGAEAAVGPLFGPFA